MAHKEMSLHTLRVLRFARSAGKKSILLLNVEAMWSHILSRISKHGGGDGMSEAVAFIAGLLAMTVVWFLTDNSPETSPYRRGYMDGYKDSMERERKEGSKL